MLLQWVNQWLKFEQHCVLCGEGCDPQQWICLACEQELPWLHHRCSCCALPLHADELGPLCPSCQYQTPAFDHVEAPWRFDFPIDALISRFKQQSDWGTGRILSHYLAHHVEQAHKEGLAKPQALVPVPSSQKRLRQRGFDHTRMLADWLSKRLHTPVETRLIRRIQDTPAQKQLNAQERQSNLQTAFQIGLNPLKYQHIAIVDDVVTTGATVNRLATLLRSIGIKRVDVYAWARTPRPESQPAPSSSAENLQEAQPQINQLLLGKSTK